MKLPNFRFTLWVLLAGLLAPLVAHAEPTLAGHPGYKGQTLDADGIKAVLLGKKTSIGDARVVIVLAKAGDAQDKFLQARVGMNTSQLQTHWRRLFMTGGGTAPKIVETPEEAAKLVAETPGAIAIIDEGAVGGLHILATK